MSEHREWTSGGYTVTTDRARVDLDTVVGFLSSSYWAEGRTHAVQAEANAGSRACAARRSPSSPE